MFVILKIHFKIVPAIMYGIMFRKYCSDLMSIEMDKKIDILKGSYIFIVIIWSHL